MPRRRKIVEGNPYHPRDVNLIDEEGVIWGIYVGGCIDERVAWGIWEGAAAHAHNDRKSPWFGWICILHARDVLTPTGKPSNILLHEYAHLLAPDVGHTAKWKRIVTELGAAKEIERTMRLNEANKQAGSKRAK